MVAPIFYQAFQWLDSFTAIGWIHYLANKPFCQYVDRLRLIGFFLAVLFTIRSKTYTHNWNWKHGWKSYPKAFLGGVCLWSLLFIIICHFTPSIDLSHPFSFLLLMQTFLASFAVACLEEIIFRGFLWDLLRVHHRTISATVGLSFLFAILHFSKCEDGCAESIFLRSLQCAGFSILHIPQHFQLSYFLCLYLLSSILIYARITRQTLWSAIGFHQGLVFLLLTLRKCFTYPPHTTSWWGTGRLIDSWFVVFVLCGLYGYCLQKMLSRKSPSFPGN